MDEADFEQIGWYGSNDRAFVDALWSLRAKPKYAVPVFIAKTNYPAVVSPLPETEQTP